MKKNQILKKLTGGDLRSIGRADEVAQDVLDNPELFSNVFEGMNNDDPRIRMRSADALQKVAEKHPEYLQPHKKQLLDEISKIDQQEVQWHVAQMLSYLDYQSEEIPKAVDILMEYINKSDSNIVIVNSLQALADLVEKDQSLKPKVKTIIEDKMKSGGPAIFSRGKKLLEKMN